VSTAAPRSPRPPHLFVLPADGDRVCLFDAIFDDTHDHGTVLGVRVNAQGEPQALVRWDDDPEGVDVGWNDLAVMRLRCPERGQNTQGNHPRTTER
jgi:hypothetical protein